MKKTLFLSLIFAMTIPAHIKAVEKDFFPGLLIGAIFGSTVALGGVLVNEIYNKKDQPIQVPTPQDNPDQKHEDISNKNNTELYEKLEKNNKTPEENALTIKQLNKKATLLEKKATRLEKKIKHNEQILQRNEQTIEQLAKALAQANSSVQTSSSSAMQKPSCLVNANVIKTFAFVATRMGQEEQLDNIQEQEFSYNF